MHSVSASNLLHSEADCADNGSRMARTIPQRCKQFLFRFMNFFMKDQQITLVIFMLSNSLVSQRSTVLYLPIPVPVVATTLATSEYSIVQYKYYSTVGSH